MRRGLEELAIVLVTQRDWTQLLNAGPMMAPLGENELHRLIEERHLNLAEVVICGDRMRRTTQQPVHNGQPETWMNIEDADAAQRLHLEQGKMTRVWQRLGELLVSDRLQL